VQVRAGGRVARLRGPLWRGGRDLVVSRSGRRGAGGGEDSSSAVTGLASLRRRARAAASSLRKVAASPARTSWAEVSHAQASARRAAGAGAEHRAEVRFPAPVMVPCSRRRWSPTRSAGSVGVPQGPGRHAASSRSVVIRVQVSDACSPSGPATRTECSATRTGSRSLSSPKGAFSQLARDRRPASPCPRCPGTEAMPPWRGR